MIGAQLVVTLDVEFLQQVINTLIVIFHAFLLCHSFKNFLIFIESGVHNFDFMAQTTQESLIDQVPWRQVRRKYHQNVKRDFDFAPGVHGHIIYAVFQRHNPAVKQIARPDLLAAKVVDQ